MKKWLLLLGMVCICSMAWAEEQLRIISLQHRLAEEVLPSVQQLVGPGGVASAVGNKLLVRTTPERLAQVEQVVAMLDVERKPLRITVSRNRQQQDVSRNLGVTGTVRRGDVAVRVPDRYGRASSGVGVEMGQRDLTVGERASEFIRVLDGGRGVISVGQSIPYTERWVMLTRRYISSQETVRFHDVTTGFSVHPQLIGDEVELEIAPRMAALSGGVIEFQELATTVRIPLGEWLDLGGTMQARDEVSREILSGGTSETRGGSQLWIRVEQ